VYAYVYIDKPIYANSDWGKRSYFTPDATDLDWDEIDPWSEAHYWKTEYIGNDILREMAEVWYSKSTFMFTGCKLMERFLTEDRWKIGLTPGNLVRNVHVTVNTASCAHTEDVQIQEELKNELGTLLDLKKEANIKITICTSFDNWALQTNVSMRKACRNAFKLTFPALYQLRDAGYRIIIAQDDYQDFAFEKAPFSIEDAVRRLVLVHYTHSFR